MSYVLKHPYEFNPEYAKPVAYLCMEYGIDQCLKIYAGGLGVLAGSHLRSAYRLRQNVVGIGILWKYGYYDQVRGTDQHMRVAFRQKNYSFLEATGIRFTIRISGHDVWVTAYYLPCEIFGTAPLFLLSTDLPENDYLARTIVDKLYDSNPESRIAAEILLGIGGVKIFEHLNWQPAVFHLNESQAIPAIFYLYGRYRNWQEVKQQVVFTSHTPEPGGNPKIDLALLFKMEFFHDTPRYAVDELGASANGLFDYTLSMLRASRTANAVSRMHLDTMKKMWNGYTGICPIAYITNSQDFSFWADETLYGLLDNGHNEAFRKHRQNGKRELFEMVADQNGKLFDKNVLTIVFARRFTAYKRAELLLHNMERFLRIVGNRERPVQIIWAGKPYPTDYTAIQVFDRIADTCKPLSNCAVLPGFELHMALLLTRGADLWLNTPRITHEASGTSGMAAAMNGTVNLTVADGWVPEFAKDKINCFLIPALGSAFPETEQDAADAEQLYDLLENELIPMYYQNPSGWLAVARQAMQDIIPFFASDRMTVEYYQKMYNHPDDGMNSTTVGKT